MASLPPRDPAYAARIHPHDRQRIVRALEVLEGTGRPFSWWHEHAMSPPLCQGPLLVLNADLGCWSRAWPDGWTGCLRQELWRRPGAPASAATIRLRPAGRASARPRPGAFARPDHPCGLPQSLAAQYPGLCQTTIDLVPGSSRGAFSAARRSFSRAGAGPAVLVGTDGAGTPVRNTSRAVMLKTPRLTLREMSRARPCRPETRHILRPGGNMRL